MFRRILITALLAGFLGGLGISVVQEFTTTPIIHHAEEYESRGSPGGHQHGNLEKPSNPLLVLAHSDQHVPAAGGTWAPAEPRERGSAQGGGQRARTAAPAPAAP